MQETSRVEEEVLARKTEHASTSAQCEPRGANAVQLSDERNLQWAAGCAQYSGSRCSLLAQRRERPHSPALEPTALFRAGELKMLHVACSA